MNKLVKGSIATAAGIALLMGGAGSLALWNDQVAVNAGSVSSGTLTVESTTAGSWSPDLDHIVPGDTVVYTEELELVAIGDNLKFTVDSNIASVTNNITGSIVDSSFVVKDSNGATVTPTAGTYDVTDGTFTVEVEISVEFPDTVGGTTGQNASVDFSALTVSVTQVA